VNSRTSRAAPAHFKEGGVRLGRSPLEALGADDAATDERARRLRDQGLALGTIAETLAKEGRQTVHGGRRAPQTVRLLLIRAT
jgi:hypothetical protein